MSNARGEHPTKGDHRDKTSHQLLCQPAFDCRIIQSIPLLQEPINVEPSNRLELQDTLLGAYMGDNFPLTSMIDTVSGVEQSSVNGYKGVTKPWVCD